MKYKLLYEIIALAAMLLLHVPAAGYMDEVSYFTDSLRLAEIRSGIDSLAKREPAYMDETDISVGEITLHELIRNIALINKLNISVKGNETLKVSCNFCQARIKDLLYFLCKEYNLNLDITGNILAIYPAEYDKLPPPVHISFDDKDSTISLDFINEPLHKIVKGISQESELNIVLPQKLYNTKVSAYIDKMPVCNALESFAKINGLKIEREHKNIWSISENMTGNGTGNVFHEYTRYNIIADSRLVVDSIGNITVAINNGNAYDIILNVCNKLKLNYFFITPPNFRASIYLKNTDANTLFNTLFAGTEYSYYTNDGVYFFGNSVKDKNLVSIEVIPLKHRAVEQVETIIPNRLKENLQIKTFDEQNSIIACGDSKDVARAVSFIKEIDKTVPLITIDIIIAESVKSRTDEAGISFGKGDETVTSTGTLSPGIDLSLGAATINRLIDDFNGFGSVKIGKVSSNFYAGLKLLESNGDIIVESTPKLSTLNGREAILTSGETQYYKEVNSSYMGTQNPVQSTSYTWKSIDANLTIKITPYVSSDSLITMNIDICQSEFTSRVEKEAPPGIVVRSFKSIIRVSNNEMVLLGGIDKNSKEKLSAGLPFISRIPVLKWIFGNSKSSKNESKLNVFIKPTLIN